jgi:hypothetical protein
MSTPAIAFCRNCGVAVCMTHLAEMQAMKPGGTGIGGCVHILPDPRDLEHVPQELMKTAAQQPGP